MIQFVMHAQAKKSRIRKNDLGIKIFSFPIKKTMRAVNKIRAKEILVALMERGREKA